MKTMKSEETIEIKDCAWGTTAPIKVITEHYEVAGSHSFGNGRHIETFESVESAEEMYGKKRRKNDNSDDYWNDQDEIITKVTVITQIVKVIKSEDKI
jgi:hypothetical protein